MSGLTAAAYADELDLSSAPVPIAAAEEARGALERLLELGVQVVDGHVPALLDIPALLAKAIEAVHLVHEALKRAALHGPNASLVVLLNHAEHRERLDMREFDKLSQAVAQAERPAEVGRSVVIAALVLLSNLAADERWYAALRAPACA